MSRVGRAERYSIDAGPQFSSSGQSRDVSAGESDRQFATTLSRGLNVLRCFSASEPLLSNKEISLRTQLPKATISRLTYTLTLLGYLRQDKVSRRYQLGSAALAMAYPLLASMRVRQTARGPMQALADRSAGAVGMVMSDRLEMVCIEACHHAAARLGLLDIGTSFSLCGSAPGTAALAGLPAARREELLNRLAVSQPELFERHRTTIRSGIDSIASMGYCIERHPAQGTINISAPLLAADQNDIIVFTCVVPSEGIQKGWLEQEIGPRLVTMAHHTESELRQSLRN